MMSFQQEIVGFDVIQALFADQKKQSLALRQEPISARKARLRSLRKWVRAHRLDIQQAVFADFKKPATEVDATEIFPVLNEISNFLTNLDQWSRPKKIDAPITMLGTRSVIKYEPRGVCLIIAPWNYPFNLCLGPLVAALAAGNAAIIKPSEITPNTSALIRKLCDEIFDKKVVAVCEGGVDVSQYLLSLPFDHIFFTGSPSIGKVVMRAAAEHLTSVTLELGGKSPAIVTTSARLKDAAQRIAVAKFINNGQTCIAPDYVWVHESMASTFMDKLKEEIVSLFSENNNPIAESPHYSRIVSDKHFDRLNGLLADAVERGGDIVMGGPIDQTSRFIHPVVLTNVPLQSRIMEEEIFGPILPVLVYRSSDEVVEYINGKPKPLALYVFGSDKGERERILTETSSGTACINDCAIQFLHHNLPFGGVNNSGIGKSHGIYGFLAFSNEKSVLYQRGGLTSIRPLYPPYTKIVKKLTDWLLKLA